MAGRVRLLKYHMHLILHIHAFSTAVDGQGLWSEQNSCLLPRSSHLLIGAEAHRLRTSLIAQASVLASTDTNYLWTPFVLVNSYAMGLTLKGLLQIG